MIKVRILSGWAKEEIGLIAGFVVKEQLYTYAIVIIGDELHEFELTKLEVINN